MDDQLDAFPRRRELRNGTQSTNFSRTTADGNESPGNLPTRPISSSAPGDAGRPRRRARIGIVLIIVLAVLGGTAVALWQPVSRAVSALGGPADYSGVAGEPTTFEVVAGDTGETIAKRLLERDIVASFDAFYKLVLKTKPEPVFVPGVFAMKKQMSARDALETLSDQANIVHESVLVREGETQAQILDRLATTLGLARSELETLAHQPHLFGLPGEAQSLEGFLFPATYSFNPGQSAKQVLGLMVQRSFAALDKAGVALDKRWWTIRLASLIQREARITEDFYKISRVFQNRLNPDLWPSGLLQSDATVSYGAGITDRVATTDAERHDASNPYNTYVHPGLVIAPISNPGDLAIDAALKPRAGSWLYFVAWNLKTGETIFSDTVAEHEAAVRKWMAWMAENPSYQ